MGIFEEAAIFRGVTKEDARQMLNCLNPVEKTYKKDEIIYHAGDEVTSMGVVLSGSVFIENDDIWGNHSILDRAGRGEIFAETYAAIPGQKLMVNVVAAEEARILFLDVGRILKVCSNSCVFHHTLIENLLKLSAEKKAETKPSPAAAKPAQVIPENSDKPAFLQFLSACQLVCTSAESKSTVVARILRLIILDCNRYRVN